MGVTTEAIWEELHQGLRQFILGRVRDEASADDILQDVFLKVHTHVDTLRDGDKVRAWIYRIARNAIHDYYRGAVPAGALPEDLLAPEEEEADPALALAPTVRRFIDRLPAESREALLLTEFEGLTQKDLAARLGLSLSGAKSRVQRARAKLKALLLDCCHFELDRAGRIIDYRPRCGCCAQAARPLPAAGNVPAR